MPQVGGRIPFVHIRDGVAELKHVRCLGAQRFVPTHPHFPSPYLQLHRAVEGWAHQQLGPPIGRLHVLVKFEDHAPVVDLGGPQFGMGCDKFRGRLVFGAAGRRSDLGA